MYKLYKITYNDGKWHSGDLPSSYYVAQSIEEVKANSKSYAEFEERSRRHGGNIWVTEATTMHKFENLQSFELHIKTKEDSQQ